MPESIAAVNKLSGPQKMEHYARFIPPELLDQFNLTRDFVDREGKSLLGVKAPSGSTDVEITLHHQFGFEDPVLYAHITDTINGQIHILLYVVNDPNSQRFDVDRMPDGSPTRFGTNLRNLAEEERAMHAGLAPGQIRSGLRMMKHSITAFERFVSSLAHDIYFIEPLYYHNAVIFERYGFAYQQGRRRMRTWNEGFQPGGELDQALDGSSPFRQPGMGASIRGRSWALHDGVAGEGFDRVTMYKHVGVSAGIKTFPGASW